MNPSELRLPISLFRNTTDRLELDFLEDKFELDVKEVCENLQRAPGVSLVVDVGGRGIPGKAYWGSTAVEE